MPASGDPYRTLGISSGASDAEVRAAYRKLVQLHHPDHNGGSEESERRFEEVQEAYARIRAMRAKSSPPPPRSRPADPDVEARMARLERELREAQAARERARQAAREAAAQAAARRAAARPTSNAQDASQRFKRPTDEELGYVTTDDSFSKILSDAREELSGRLSDAREHPVAKRVSDLIDELEELVSKATRGPRT